MRSISLGQRIRRQVFVCTGDSGTIVNRGRTSLTGRGSVGWVVRGMDEPLVDNIKFRIRFTIEEILLMDWWFEGMKIVTWNIIR